MLGLILVMASHSGLLAAEQGDPFLTRPVLKFKLHFRKQDGRSRNVGDTAYEILPGGGKFRASLVLLSRRYNLALVDRLD